MKKKICKLMMGILMVASLILVNSGTANASWSQTEKTKKLSVKKNVVLKAYSAFDRMGSKMSNGMEWDYKGKSSITGLDKNGTLKLTIEGHATLRNSASASIGVADISAGSSSAWQYVSSSYSQSKAVKKKSGTQSISDTSNLIIVPSKYYDTGTAGITVTASFKYSGGKKVYRISSCA